MQINRYFNMFTDLKSLKLEVPRVCLVMYLFFLSIDNKAKTRTEKRFEQPKHKAVYLVNEISDELQAILSSLV